MPACSLWINVARTDVSFMMRTIPHLARMCDYPFSERVLAVDTTELSGEKKLRPYAGSLEQLRECCRRLVDAKTADRIAEIDYSDAYRKRIYKKYFGTGRIRPTHNYKGYPVLGSIFCIEECKVDYLLHFDSDMLLYQEKGFDWIGRGIRLMEEDPGIFWARPSAGPQSDAHNLYTGTYKTAKDPRGFYPVGGFSSRCFLLHKKRFESILPMKILWAKRQRAIIDKLPRSFVEMCSTVFGRGLLESWEKMVCRRAVEKGLMSAHIADKAWTVHPKDHDDVFIRELPDIIKKVESGWYPDEQAGLSDLKIEYWRRK